MKRKNLLKKISLGAVGVASIGAIAFGVCKIVQFCKNDSKTLSLDYSVGALTDEGKYQEDECKLYTKKAFACEGLRVTFDFDAEVNGQFYFYDINDKYLSKSDVVTEGSSVSVPLNGAYARAVVIPTNDEDGSISFTEKYKYSSQMQVKVDKKAEDNISKKFLSYKDSNFEVCQNLTDLVFNSRYEFSVDKGLTICSDDRCIVTAFNVLNVEGYKSLALSSDTADNLQFVTAAIYEFDSYDLNNAKIVRKDVGVKTSSIKNQSINFEKSTKLILITCWGSESTDISKIPSNFVLSK